MSVGTPSQRKYHLFDIKSKAQTDQWNRVVARPTNTKDMRWADCLKFFPYPFVVTPTSLPPASVHLSDQIVGQLLAMAKAGHIELKVLGQRWPNVFNASGILHKARRPLGDPYLIKGKIAATNDGIQLLCGAKYGKLPRPGKPPASWFWLLDSSNAKSRLIATDLDGKAEALPSDQTFRYDALDASQLIANAFPKGRIYEDASSTSNPLLTVSWSTGEAGAQKLKPKPVQSVKRKPDKGHEKKDDLEGDFTDREDGDSVQDKFGIVAFALETPNLTAAEVASRKDFTQFKDLVRKEAAVKLEDLDTETRNPGREGKKSLDSASGTPVTAKGTPVTAKGTPQSDKQTSGGKTRFKFGRRDLSSSSESEEAPFPSRSPSPPKSTAAASLVGPEDVAGLIKRIYQYEEAMASAVALTTRFVSGSYDLATESLEIVHEQAKDMGAGKVDEPRAKELRTFVKHVKRRMEAYSGEFMEKLADFAGVLAGSGYDLEQILATNNAEGLDNFPASSVHDRLPEKMEILDSAFVHFSATKADYPVNDRFKKTQTYQNAITAHLTQSRGENFYRGPPDTIEGAAAGGAGDEVAEAVVEPSDDDEPLPNSAELRQSAAELAALRGQGKNAGETGSARGLQDQDKVEEELDDQVEDMAQAGPAQTSGSSLVAPEDQEAGEEKGESSKPQLTSRIRPRKAEEDPDIEEPAAKRRRTPSVKKKQMDEDAQKLAAHRQVKKKRGVAVKK